MAIDYLPRFLSALELRDDGGFPFTLINPLGYVTNVGHKGTFYVPRGFKTDLASIPRLLWRLLPPIGKYDKAAVVHDYLYQFNGVTRKEADSILLEAMTVLGVGKWTRRTIYAGVRVGWWVVWNRYRRAECI